MHSLASSLVQVRQPVKQTSQAPVLISKYSPSGQDDVQQVPSMRIYVGSLHTQVSPTRLVPAGHVHVEPVNVIYVLVHEHTPMNQSPQSPVSSKVVSVTQPVHISDSYIQDSQGGVHVIYKHCCEDSSYLKFSTHMHGSEEQSAPPPRLQYPPVLSLENS